ncbi:MAG: LrgB family protein [Eubacteriales bacterium]|nr:LrgB family protein [Eubacteriales bacterium]
MAEFINNYLSHSTYFAIAMSIAFYMLGIELKKRFKLAIFAPLIVASVLTLVVIVVFHIDMDVYNASGNYISFMINAATVCYGMLLYEQLHILKNNFKAIMIGILVGVFSMLTIILIMSVLLHIGHEQYVSLLPKACTTAIGLGIAEANGGYPSITIVWILITGNLGNAIAEPLVKFFKIEEPVARGVAIGCSSHAVGTAKALEIGEIEGAISGLSLAVTGLITVVVAAVYAQFY